MMADKDLSLFVFGEDTEPFVASCAAAGASTADSIDNGSSDDDNDDPS